MRRSCICDFLVDSWNHIADREGEIFSVKVEVNTNAVIQEPLSLYITQFSVMKTKVFAQGFNAGGINFEFSNFTFCIFNLNESVHDIPPSNQI